MATVNIELEELQAKFDAAQDEIVKLRKQKGQPSTSDNPAILQKGFIRVWIQSNIPPGELHFADYKKDSTMAKLYKAKLEAKTNHLLTKIEEA